MSWEVDLPHKNGSIPLWLAHHMITSKSPSNLYDLPSPLNMTTMISQHTKFPPTTRFPRQTWSPGYSIPTANFGPPSRSSVTNPMLITVWYLFDPKVTGSLSLIEDSTNSECTAFTHFSMSLPDKYMNLKDPYNQDIKEQVTTKKFLKKKTGFTWNPQPQRHSVQKVFFKFNLLFVVLTFQIILYE